MHQVKIIDPKSLQRVLETVKRLTGGDDRSAAKALGIGQPTFTRLRNGTTSDFVRVKTYDAMVEGLRRNPLEFGLLGQLENAFLVGEAWLVLQQYRAWAEREISRLEASGARSIFDQLYLVPAYRRHFDRLLKRTGREVLPDANDLRAWISLLRMVEPLAAAAPSAGVMPGWEELEEKEEEDLHFYLRAAERRERALLGRESPLDRIRERGLRASDEFKAWLADDGQ